MGGFIHLLLCGDHHDPGENHSGPPACLMAMTQFRFLEDFFELIAWKRTSERTS